VRKGYCPLNLFLLQPATDHFEVEVDALENLRIVPGALCFKTDFAIADIYS